MALDAGDGVTRHVLVGFSEPADQAEAAAVSQTAASTGGAATTAAGSRSERRPPRLALDAVDGVAPLTSCRAPVTMRSRRAEYLGDYGEHAKPLKAEKPGPRAKTGKSLRTIC